MSVARCPGDISTGAAGEAVCSVPWEVFDWASSIDPVEASLAFSAGFFIMASFWVAIVGLVVAVRFVKSRI